MPDLTRYDTDPDAIAAPAARTSQDRSDELDEAPTLGDIVRAAITEAKAAGSEVRMEQDMLRRRELRTRPMQETAPVPEPDQGGVKDG